MAEACDLLAGWTTQPWSAAGPFRFLGWADTGLAPGSTGSVAVPPAGPPEVAGARALVIPGVGHFAATAALDEAWRRAVREFIADYNRRTGATMIVTRHYMADVLELCPRTILIHQGQQPMGRGS